MATETRDLIPFEPQPQQIGVVRPLVKPTDMLVAIREYEALKSAIIQPSDKQRIGNKDHIKKSGWLRIARAFGLTVEPVREEFQTAEDGTWGYAIVVRAIAPNGASMQGDGLCWSTEKKQEIQRTRHNVRAHAYTRATNRAISNLVGGGEVSAEEMQDYVDEDPRHQQQTQQRQERQAPAPRANGTHNPSALKARANGVGITGKAWGDLWNEYKNNLDGLDLYLTAKEAAQRQAPVVDESTEIEYALEGLPVSGMH